MAAPVSPVKSWPSPEKEGNEQCCSVCNNTFHDEKACRKHLKQFDKVCVCPLCGERLPWEVDSDKKSIRTVPHSSHRFPNSMFKEFQCVTCLSCFDSDADLYHHMTEKDDKFGCLCCSSTFSSCADRIDHLSHKDHYNDELRLQSIKHKDFTHTHTRQKGPEPTESSGIDNILSRRTVNLRRRLGFKNAVLNITQYCNKKEDNDEEEKDHDHKEEENDIKENDDVTATGASPSKRLLKGGSRDLVMCSQAIQTCKQAILHCKLALLDLPVSLAVPNPSVIKLALIQKMLQAAVHRLVPVMKSNGENEETQVICADSTMLTASLYLEKARDASSQPEAVAQILATWFREPPMTSTKLLLPSDDDAGGEEKRLSVIRGWLSMALEALFFVERIV